LEPGDDPVPRRSVVNLDLVESVSVALLIERIGRLSELRMREICAALEVATDCR
jgi:mRNA interferase MazF